MITSKYRSVCRWEVLYQNIYTNTCTSLAFAHVPALYPSVCQRCHRWPTSAINHKRSPNELFQISSESYIRVGGIPALVWWWNLRHSLNFPLREMYTVSHVYHLAGAFNSSIQASNVLLLKLLQLSPMRCFNTQYVPSDSQISLRVHVLYRHEFA